MFGNRVALLIDGTALRSAKCDFICCRNKDVCGLKEATDVDESPYRDLGVFVTSSENKEEEEVDNEEAARDSTKAVSARAAIISRVQFTSYTFDLTGTEGVEEGVNALLN